MPLPALALPFIGLLKDIPPWLLICGAALAWGGWNHHRLGSLRAELSDLKAEYAQAERDSKEREREAYTLRSIANGKVTIEQSKQQQRNQVSAAGSAAELKRLRQLLAETADRNTPAGPGVDDGSTPASILSECSTEYQSLAKTVDKLSTQITGLQGYTRTVCVTSPDNQK